MGTHPLNLAIRFLLEIAALVFAGMWGWRQGESWLQYLLAIGLPVLLAVVWVTFAVPNDPSRSGEAPVVTPGLVRLLIELGIFAFASWCLYDMKFTNAGLIFGIIVLLHYIISYDRILWLLKH